MTRDGSASRDDSIGFVSESYEYQKEEHIDFPNLCAPNGNEFCQTHYFMELVVKFESPNLEISICITSIRNKIQEVVSCPIWHAII